MGTQQVQYIKVEFVLILFLSAVLGHSLYSGGLYETDTFSAVLRYEEYEVTIQKWTQTGDMTEPRDSHAVSTVTWDTVAPLCTSVPHTTTTPPPCVPTTCDAANCLTYPNTDNYPCSNYPNNADQVTLHN